MLQFKNLFYEKHPVLMRIGRIGYKKRKALILEKMACVTLTYDSIILAMILSIGEHQKN